MIEVSDGIGVPPGARASYKEGVGARVKVHCLNSRFS